MFPFNMPPGEYWVLIYLLMVLVVYAVAAAGSQWLVSRNARSAVNAQAPYDPVDPRRFYRVAPQSEVAHRRLTLGSLPKSDEHTAIAFLRRGGRGVAETLLGSAVSGGWLFRWKNRFERSPNEPPHGTLLGAFVTDIPSGTSDATALVVLARKHAQRAESAIKSDLEQAGLLPDALVVKGRPFGSRSGRPNGSGIGAGPAGRDRRARPHELGTPKRIVVGLIDSHRETSLLFSALAFERLAAGGFRYESPSSTRT